MRTKSTIFPNGINRYIAIADGVDGSSEAEAFTELEGGLQYGDKIIQALGVNQTTNAVSDVAESIEVSEAEGDTIVSATADLSGQTIFIVYDRMYENYEDARAQT